ncbi:TonB-dependent receptor domain-containing protein [Flavobacterium sp. XGLA_31]|uniref:TonB-dependent receptor n=1 Tax=Flavobacterium sp. XGLA_31 TaxID=3447666 RepID=UPI003F40EB9D
MKFKLVITFLLLTVFAFAQNKGTITGTITDKDLNNETLPFANVVIKGTTIGVTTDATGKYTLSLAAGSYTIQFSFLGYETIEEKVEVKAGETIVLNKALGSGNYQLKDVVVQNTSNREKETALLLEQKKATEIKQSIGAQEMSRKGVSNVEQGLTKITGISKVGSRGIFVRGLEDRYNNLLVNDLAVPSNNPYRKIIPLDMFSTDIVGVIDVYKTFNPSISGDFAGATFNVATTKNVSSQTKLSIGLGYTTDNNLHSFSLSKDANSTKGFLGLTGRDRSLPSVITSVPTGQQLTVAQAQEGFKSGWNVDETKSPLNTSIGLLHSEKFKFKNDQSFSYLLSINADNSYTQTKGPDNTFNINGDFNNNAIKTESHYKTSVASLLSLNYKASRFNLTSNTFYLRSTDNLIQDQVGAFDNNLDNHNVIVRTNQFEQSDYLNSQLLGELHLKEDKSQSLKGGISMAKTSYKQPDRKIFKGGIQGENVAISYGANNFLRQYLDVSGDVFASGFLEYNLKFGKKQNNLALGYNGNGGYTKTTYRFIKTDGAGIINQPLNSLDDQMNIDLENGVYSYLESSTSNYKTKMVENSNSAYANLLLKFGDKWEINGGLRFEKFNRDIRYRPLGNFSAPYDKLKTDKDYVLPSINVKYAATERANIRFAASKNFTKPVIMEIIPISYINGDGTIVQGNPDLINSDNINTDLKYEFFPTNKELFVIGAFAKHLDNPIERTFRGEAGGFITTFLNSDKADLYGIEMEGILDLARLNKSLSNFSLGLNATLMNSKVTASSDAETHKNRELQGASKWLINSDLKYQFEFSEKWSNTVSLVYGVFGKRIYSVGSLGYDHIYELPFQQLDFVWNSKISEKYALKFGVNNILNPTRKYELGKNNDTSLINFVANSRTYEAYKKGVGFSLSFSYTF